MARRKDKPTILLVEDTTTDAELTLCALRRHAVAACVEVACDGEQALERLFDEALPVPNLILLDLKLPRVDGLEVLRRVKEDRRTRNVPVVVLTSSREPADLSRSYDLGANSYLVKPLDAEDFAKSVAMLGSYWVGLNETALRAAALARA